MTISTERLLPCPFCGAKARLHPRYWAGRIHLPAYVDCSECDCALDTTGDHEEADAIAAWNRRSGVEGVASGPISELLGGNEQAEGMPLSNAPPPSALSRITPMALDPKGLEKAVREYLLHRGEQPSRITKRGAELWEDYEAPIAAAITAYLQHAGEAEPVGYITEAALELMATAKPGWHYHMFAKYQSDPKATIPIFAAPHPHQAPGAAVECATAGCGKLASVRFERGGVGSWYCHDCYMRIQAIPPKAGE